MHHVFTTSPEVATFLLRVERHERTGLTRRCAILAASSDLGIDPAVVIRAARREVPQ
jgi:hypothetical protein